MRGRCVCTAYVIILLLVENEAGTPTWSRVHVTSGPRDRVRPHLLSLSTGLYMVGGRETAGMQGASIRNQLGEGIWRYDSGKDEWYVAELRGVVVV